jgi:hypothetical protein
LGNSEEPIGEEKVFFGDIEDVVVSLPKKGFPYVPSDLSRGTTELVRFLCTTGRDL